jgi:hypothetical protein
VQALCGGGGRAIAVVVPACKSADLRAVSHANESRRVRDSRPAHPTRVGVTMAAWRGYSPVATPPDVAASRGLSTVRRADVIKYSPSLAMTARAALRPRASRNCRARHDNSPAGRGDFPERHARASPPPGRESRAWSTASTATSSGRVPTSLPAPYGNECGRAVSRSRATGSPRGSPVPGSPSSMIAANRTPRTGEEAARRSSRGESPQRHRCPERTRRRSQRARSAIQPRTSVGGTSSRQRSPTDGPSIR